MGSKEHFSVSKYSQGKFEIKNVEKYAGKRTPTYRSSWEWAFMNFCDNHPNIIQWANESIHIPYYNPFTQKNTIYVPDFFVVYQGKDGVRKVELVEIKPSGEVMETVGKGQRNQAMAALNHCKWQAAQAWCKSQGITFRVITENEMFHNPKKVRKFKTR
jgi:hypothetical protein